MKIESSRLDSILNRNFSLGAITLGLGLLTAFSAQAEVGFTSLVSFAATNGSNPAAEMILGRDGNFYGTTLQGGTNDFGTVFKLAPDWSLTALASFNSNNGAYPRGGLVQSPSGSLVLYGTTAHGGAHGVGNVFKAETKGALSSLYDFAGPDGANPEAGLLWNAAGTDLVGVTYFGGTNGLPNGYGTIFQTTTAGAFTSRFSFGNSNGANPFAALILAQDGNYYGTTQFGGTTFDGTVFKMTPAGTVTTLLSFQGTNGSRPLGRLYQSADGLLYGSTYGGGTNDLGTLFKLTTNGVLTTLVHFAGTNGSAPYSGLTRGPDGALYGTTSLGGTTGRELGTAFRLTTGGTFSTIALTTVVSFEATNGAYPLASLAVGPDGNLYGTTSKGGTTDDGTVFKLSIPTPEQPVILTATESGGVFTATYSAVPGFNYQVYYHPDLGTATWIPLGGPVTANNTVMSFSDNLGANAKRFYRVALVLQ